MGRAIRHAPESPVAPRRADRSGRGGPPRSRAGITRTIMVGGALSAMLSVGACSDGAADTTTDRPRPTDTAGVHDHSAQDSALAPDVVLPSDLAELGEGPQEGESFSALLGINVCGRFLELPDAGTSQGISLDATGSIDIQPGPGDPTGHEVTAGSVFDLMDVSVVTGEIAFGPSWASTVAALDGEEVPLGSVTLETGDSCGGDPGEVQLWYYTPDAVESGKDIKMVVTDPQDVPIVADGSAMTLAFAPGSSLPTLPPAALVN